VKETVIAAKRYIPRVAQNEVKKKAPLKKGPKMCPMVSCHISDTMWNISSCSVGQYMTITGVQVTASYMYQLVIVTWPCAGGGWVELYSPPIC
jgi:hypothetical protein